ncbi:MAG: hypothetical protein K1Y36_12365 [Blastocatellia bacterium]|nr:hypothetical protein [Blastocatellia bacterium]
MKYLRLTGWSFLPHVCGLLVVAYLLGGVPVAGKQEPQTGEKPKWTDTANARRAVVADTALAALRLNPAVTGRVKQRLRAGRAVYILQSQRNREGVRYDWVAVTRRTRGWIDHRALVRIGVEADAMRLLKLMQAESNEFDRLRLACLFLDLFPKSPHKPEVLLDLGQTADREAPALTRRAERRVREAATSQNTDEKTYFDNDSGLDRYNRLGVVFRYDETGAGYAYDGWAYREILRLYPHSPQAQLARERRTAPARQK